MDPVELVGFLAGGAGMVQAWPQVRRIRRLGHSAGVSLGTWMLTFIVVAAWCGWGVSVQSPAAIITNGVATVLSGAVVAALVSFDSRPLLWLPALGVGIVALVIALPAAITNAVLVALTCSRVPQVRQSWRSRRAGTPSAVSIHSLGFGLLSGALWLLWALLADHPLVLVTTFITSALMATIAVLEWPALRTRGAIN